MTEKKTEVAPDQIEVTDEEINYFKQMFAVNVNDKLDQKNGLSYLSWAWAWAETKRLIHGLNKLFTISRMKEIMMLKCRT